MEKKLKSLGCVPFRDFLILLNIQINSDIFMPNFIAYDKLPLVTNTDNILPISDLLRMCVLHCLKKNIPNVIVQGYKLVNDELVINAPNNIIDVLLRMSELLTHLGDDLFMEIIIFSKMFVYMPSVDKMNNLLLISGYVNFSRNISCIKRHKLFYKNKDKVNIIPEDLLNECDYKRIINTEVFEKCSDKYKKLCIRKLFNSYMKSQNDVIEPKKLINFLFCISKKIFQNIYEKYNFRILKQKLTLLIYKNKYESFSEEEIIRYFKIQRFRFFYSNNKKPTKNESASMREFTKKYLFFIFNEFYIPLMNKYVYSTESCYSKFKCLYYIRHKWYQFSEKCIKENLFDDKKFTIKKSKNKLQINNCRIIPKLNGGRMVVNLGLISNLNVSNIHLRHLYEILKNKYRKSLCNSMLGFEDMKDRLYPLFNKKNLFVLKLDVANCFDNIQHKFVKKLLAKLIKHDKYVVKPFSELVFDTEEFFTKKKQMRCNKKVIVDLNYTYKNYEDYFRCFTNKIIIDDCATKEYTRDELQKTMERVVFDNKISYKDMIATQIKGIPQGSIISTLLCSLYYSELDKKYFNKIVVAGKIFRYIDDFLVVSKDKEEILRFLDITKKMSKMGVTFNAEKTESNFIVENNEFKIKNSQLNYLGMKIITCDGQIYIKNIMNDKNIGYSCSAPCSNIGRSIFKKMSRFVDSRSHILINLNNVKVLENIYDSFVIYTWKLQLLFKRAIFINYTFYERLINFCTEKMYKICKKRKINVSLKKLQDIMKTVANKYMLNSNKKYQRKK